MNGRTAIYCLLTGIICAFLGVFADRRIERADIARLRLQISEVEALSVQNMNDIGQLQNDVLKLQDKQ